MSDTICHCKCHEVGACCFHDEGIFQKYWKACDERTQEQARSARYRKALEEILKEECPCGTAGCISPMAEIAKQALQDASPTLDGAGPEGKV